MSHCSKGTLRYRRDGNRLKLNTNPGGMAAPVSFCLSTGWAQAQTRDRTAIGGKAALGIIKDARGCWKTGNLQRSNEDLKSPTAGCRGPCAESGGCAEPALARVPWKGTHSTAEIPPCVSTGGTSTWRMLSIVRTLLLHSHSEHGQFSVAHDFVLTCSFQIQGHRKRHAPFSQKGCLIHKHAFYSFGPLRCPPVP